MVTTNEERAVHLAREAVELGDAGHREAAARNIREAISLAPHNPEVRSAFDKVRQEEQGSHHLLDRCRRYAAGLDEEAGKDAVRYLRTDGLKPPEDVALECLQLLLAHDPATLSAHQDEIISGLVRQNASVRKYFATQLLASVTAFFDEIYDRGDGAAVCLDTVVLDPSVWPSDDDRAHCESELFQLFIAKLMESGHDLDGRSLKGITRLLAVDAAKLQHLVDDEGLDVILCSCDSRLPLEVRSQATLAVAKYLDAAKESGEQRLSHLLAARIAKGRNDDLIIAFSALTAVFPVAPSVTAALFLSDSLLQSLRPLASRAAKSRRVEETVLELLNAACIDRTCRQAVSRDFSDWLSHLLTNGCDSSSELAAVVLAKLRASPQDQGTTAASSDPNHGKVLEEDSVPELVERFKGLMSRRNKKVTVENLHHAIEGLAYSSIKPTVKEQLVQDAGFLGDLIAAMQANLTDSSVLYGGLMILLNVTAFLPALSEEQKKMSQLKSYANANGPGGGITDPLDDDDHVLSRCQAVVDAGVMPLFVECAKSPLLPSIQDLVSKVLLALSRNRATRGTLAQQGAVRLLVTLATIKTTTGAAPVGNVTAAAAAAAAAPVNAAAAHALARILISVNPMHVFPPSGFPPITSAIRPLVSLLASQGSSASASGSGNGNGAVFAEQSRDLLPVFESLLALTNLASYPDETAAAAIVRQAWATVEDLLLSRHTLVQRAACELVCNLMTSEAGIVQFADGSKRAAQRLHILLALTDVEDAATRKAAGGALAMLTEFDAAVAAVLERPRGVELLLALCADEDSDLAHRGVVCVRNLTCTAGGDIGSRARQAVRLAGGVDILRTCLQRTRNPAVLQAGVDALRPLIE
ncbi:hypothetical protein ASPZODRAFT_162804 [Penicilliopsis zonata CBS 506.65]|uniref:UNC-45/Cro1/She4 central domain-containing protein n=1 Tax=Penicilliopsis zonata CBS 506.65 TaxID=1073090 RepID=A0A1L9SUU0_9EURO|nr:hypothetical protein ASPZODRAFT_162804 [Penicilliopsis zonata CBS 506.65]OJJ50906.1 hypothetical protein ASPZODRAFT_162804 [Penicilliopsis zonata CBS 506.65]